MNDSNGITESMGDFAALLVREVSQSLALARYDAPLVRVDRVRVRFGKEGGGESVITDRYPFLADGWEVEMELGAEPLARLHGPPVEPERKLLDVFGDRPTSAVKGVSRDWAVFLEGNGIVVVRDLAGVSPTSLHEVFKERSPIRLWEIQGKARLLDSGIPFIPPSPLDSQDLYALIRMGPDRIAVEAPNLTGEEVRRLSDILQLLTVVLDADVLKDTPLADLSAH